MKTGKAPYPEFALRMQQAAEANPNVPPPNFGRLGWFVNELEAKHGYQTTIETIRKWFAGETMPRQKTCIMLAQVLGVDPSWLSLGARSDVSQKVAKARNAIADGFVNILAGMIQSKGWSVAFPDAADKDALRRSVDLTTIIKGAMYDFHVCAGVRDGGDWSFSVPYEALDTFVLGMVEIEDMHYVVIELESAKVTEMGTRKGGSLNVILPENFDGWRVIPNFTDRI